MRKFFIFIMMSMIVSNSFSQELLFRVTFDDKLTDEVGPYEITPKAGLVPTYVDGKYGKAISLNGANNEYYDVTTTLTSGIDPKTNAMTYAAWIYSTITDAQRDSAVAAGTSGLAEQQIIHFLGGGNTRVVLHAVFNDVTANIATWGATGASMKSTVADCINRNEWQHLAIVTDPTALTVTFYVNGVQVGDVLTVEGAFNLVAPGNGIYRIGAHKLGDRSGFFGYLDEVCMFSGALSVDQIQQVMANNYNLTAVRPVLSDEVRILTNPVKDIIILEGVENVKQLTLLTLDGRNVLKSNRTNTLELPGVASGNYLLKVELTDGTLGFRKVSVIK
jgi:hypothetical protein